MNRGRQSPVGDRAARRIGRRLAAVAVTLAAAAAVLWCVSRLGDDARRGVSTHDRYRVRFADIQCNPPPGVDRSTFLAEVRYLAAAPETVQSLDPALADTLTASFSRHPWVAAVERVTVDRDGAVHVSLRHRKPRLALRMADGVRVVDEFGIVLPIAADARGLPEWITKAPSPLPDAGRPWPDEDVGRALELADAHHPRTLEKGSAGWRLSMADGKVLIVK